MNIELTIAQFLGLCALGLAAAARLGVSRTQLREVVLGNRQSKRLMARIRAAGIKVEEGK